MRTNGMSAPALRPAFCRPARHERGSVLIVCIGILVVLAVMATTLLSVVSYQRTISRSYQRTNFTEMAALAAQDHAIAFLDAESAEDNVTTLHGPWAKQFEMLRIDAGPDQFQLRHWEWDDGSDEWDPVDEQPVSGPFADDYDPENGNSFTPIPGPDNDVTDYGATDLWNFLVVPADAADPDEAKTWDDPYLADPYPEDRERNGWARWFLVQEYDKNWKPIPPDQAGSGHYTLRYAVGIVDLTGRFLVHPHEEMLSGGEPDLWAERLGWLLPYDPSENDPALAFEATTAARDAATAVYEAPYSGTPGDVADDIALRSFDHLRAVWLDAAPGTTVETRALEPYLRRLTPFGDLGWGLSPGEVDPREVGAQFVGWRINVLTAPRALLESMVWGLAERSLLGAGDSYGSDDDLDIGAVGVDLLEQTDGRDGTLARVGPLSSMGAADALDLSSDDAETWTDPEFPLPGGSHEPPVADRPTLDLEGDAPIMSEDDYFHDIAYALFAAVNNMRIKAYEAARRAARGEADAYGDVSMYRLQESFVQILDPWDIMRVYNAAWDDEYQDTLGGDPASTVSRQWEIDDPDAVARSERMEMALNDVLQSLWGDEVAPYDADENDDPEVEGDELFQGLYAYDWDGSEAVDMATPTTYVDSDGTFENYWSPIHDPGVLDDDDLYHEYPADPADAGSDYLHGPAEAVANKTGGYPGDGTVRIRRQGRTTPPSSHGDAHLSWTGEWFIGRSRFWHVVVRAELVEQVGPTAPSVIARSDLEFVYVSDPNNDGDASDGHVLYQRWIQRGE